MFIQTHIIVNIEWKSLNLSYRKSIKNFDWRTLLSVFLVELGGKFDCFSRKFTLQKHCSMSSSQHMTQISINPKYRNGSHISKHAPWHQARWLHFIDQSSHNASIEYWHSPTTSFKRLSVEIMAEIELHTSRINAYRRKPWHELEMMKFLCIERGKFTYIYISIKGLSISRTVFFNTQLILTGIDSTACDFRSAINFPALA